MAPTDPDPDPAPQPHTPSSLQPDGTTTTPATTRPTTTPINAQTQPNQQHNPTSRHRQAQNRPGRTPAKETLFSVPNHNIVTHADAPTYRELVLTMHKNLAGGSASEYTESKLPLPRTLQGMKTSLVIAKILELNPSLNSDDWADVSADVVGNNLVIGTTTAAGRRMIDGLKELRLEHGRITPVPASDKPNNFYFVEILLPHERELHIDFFEAFLLKFPTAKYASMPGKMAWGTTRRIRLYFTVTVAPREVFTEEDPTIPIREVKLPCGTAAPVIHKWQRLNQFRPPHLSHRWNHQGSAPSYAAAAATSHRPHHPTTDGHRPAFQPSPNHPTPRQTQIDHPNIGTTATQPTRATQHARRPDNPSVNPPIHTRPAVSHRPPTTAPHTNNQQPHPVDPPATDWMTDDPFPSPPDAPNHHTRTDNQNANHITSPTGPPTNETNLSTRTPRTDNNRDTEENVAPTSANMTTVSNQITATPPADTPDRQTRPSPSTIGSNTPHPDDHATTLPQSSTPNLSGTPDTQQWHQIRRSRSRTIAAQAQNGNNTTLKKSSSRHLRSRSNNKFAPLDFEIHPAFEDDEVAPIEITLLEKPLRPPRRKFKNTRKAFSKHVTEAIAHHQQIRHPANTLQHLSPRQTQVILGSKTPSIRPGRDRLIQQIALLRAARSNNTEHDITLDPITDNAFLQQVQSRLSDCTNPPRCDLHTDIDIPLSAILDSDELQVRNCFNYAWVDLATRATLPHLYDAWPDRPVWNGSTLNWLASTDGETPCLQNEALAMLAACPSLQNVWTHLGSTNSDLNNAIKTAANQWYIFTKSPQASKEVTS